MRVLAEVAPREAAKVPETVVPVAAGLAVNSSHDLGPDRLHQLIQQSNAPQFAKELAEQTLQPKLEQALIDKQYNPRGISLSPEQLALAKFTEWLDAFDVTVVRLAVDHKQAMYSAAVRKIQAGEVWLEPRNKDDVTSALASTTTDVVLQTDFEGRQAVADWLSQKQSTLGKSATMFSLAGSKNMTARFMLFVEGDGYRVVESAKSLDEAQTFRRRAIRDYLMQLPR
jgi:hypothetical protein